MKPATPTLLYIDDDAGLARLVDRGLTRAGFKVVHAASGEQGLARLAQGGMAEVWLATDVSLDRKVALKWLKPSLATDPVVAERV